MKQLSSRTEMKAEPEKMPFQAKYLPVVRNAALERALAAYPVFGGTSAENSDSSSGESGTPSSTTSSNGETSSSGGESTSTTEQMSPEKIQELVSKVTDLTSQVTTLSQENAGYKAEEEKNANAALSREEALAKDLDKSNQTIAQMDAVIKHLAIINAVTHNESGIQFHEPSGIVRELNEDGFELNIDLERGTASVKGIENELKRIANEKSWLVKAAVNDQQQQTRTTQKPPTRSSGTPPANPSQQNNAASRRAALEQRWPVINQGGAKLPKLTR